MDPDVTWQELTEALQTLASDPTNDEVRTRALERLILLYQWLRHGGFPPRMP